MIALFKGRTGKFLFIFVFIAIIWLIFLLDSFFHFKLTFFSIYPRRMDSLLGILTSSFFHYDFNHIMSNTVPLFIFMLILLIFSDDSFFFVIFSVLLINNVFTWFLGNNSYHLGISGLIYGLFSFNLVSGLYRKNFIYMFINLIVMFLYIASVLGGLFPSKSYISYSSHWFGILSGILLAVLESKKLKSLPKVRRLKKSIR